MDLDGTRALVTSGTRGIGAATARLLADRGAQVVVCGRTEPSATPHGVRFVAADLTAPDGPEQLAATTLELLGGLDVLVDNAGTQITHERVEDFTDADWLQELQIHLLASVRLDRALLPALIDSRGAIVHVSSVVARLPEPTVIAYATAKAALAVYSKGLSRQVGPQGVRVNTVLPGFVATDMMTERVTAMAAEQGQPYEDFVASMMQRMGVPLERAATADELAETIAYLASPAAAYVTGAQIVADGGITRNVF